MAAQESAEQHVLAEEQGVSEARKQVARTHRDDANSHARSAKKHAREALERYTDAESTVAALGTALRTSESALAKIPNHNDLAAGLLSDIKSTRNALKQAVDNANAAKNRAVAARDAARSPTDVATNLRDALEQLEVARRLSTALTNSVQKAREYALMANDTEAEARSEATRVHDLANRTGSLASSTETAADGADRAAGWAVASAKAAGRVLDKEAAAAVAWANAEAEAAFQAARARENAAQSASDENGVRRAQDASAAAETLATHEWQKAQERLKETLAIESAAQARTIVRTQSPYVFEGVAHFPVREFTESGSLIEREGAIIYEGMKLTFDEDGNYNVSLRAGVPASVPTTLRLQIQFTPENATEAHTITLAPIEFRPEENDRAPWQRKIHTVERSGQSPALKRIYGRIDHKSIARRGTARFGFGFDSPRWSRESTD